MNATLRTSAVTAFSWLLQAPRPSGRSISAVASEVSRPLHTPPYWLHRFQRRTQLAKSCIYPTHVSGCCRFTLHTGAAPLLGSPLRLGRRPGERNHGDSPSLALRRMPTTHCCILRHFGKYECVCIHCLPGDLDTGHYLEIGSCGICNYNDNGATNL